MKILITTDLFTTATNGVVTSIRNLWDELQKRGHDIRILTISDSVKSHREGSVYYIRSVSLEKVYPNVRMPTAYRHRLIRELIEWKPDVIHSQCELFSFRFALRISRHTGAPIVHTYHTLYDQYVQYVFPSERIGRRFVRMASREILKDVDTIIVPSRKIEDTLASYGMQNTVCIVPSGIDLEKHKQRMPALERRDRRQELGIGESDTVLLSLGRMGTEKNLDELLRLFAEAAAETPELVFLLVGDGPARAALEQQAEKSGLRGRVIFTGMVAPEQVHTYYQLSDVFVCASTSETQGLTYIEAAANGLPLLCRRDPCLLDVIRDGENGYQYETDVEFHTALRKMLQDTQWRERAKRYSEEMADGFDKSTFGDSIEAIYRSVLKPKADSAVPESVR